MPRAADPTAVTDVLGVLAGLRDRCTAVEDDLFGALAVLGEPVGQRRLDDWVDQAADTVRALAEEATAQAMELPLVAGTGYRDNR